MHEVGWHYERARQRIDGLLRTADDGTWNALVPACPGWRARDVVAHLYGSTEDAAAGRLNGPPTPEQTRAQVDRHRDDDPVALLDAWAEAGPFVAAVVSQTGMWPAAVDAVTHEHDIRGAIGRPGARDDESITELATLMGTIDAPRPVAITFDGTGAVEPPADGAIELRTTAFELVRLRMGRRSRRQVEAMEWSDDPTDVLPHLFVFGPAATDIVE